MEYENLGKVVELKVVSITNSQTHSPAFSMLLQDNKGRQLSIQIGPAEAQAITFKLNDIKTSRPLTHDLFAKTLSYFGIDIFQVLIYKAEDGVFFTHIYYKKDDQLSRIDSRTSDAIALALRTDAPICIQESLLKKECVKKEPSSDIITEESTDVDFDKKDVKTLHKQLAKAIQEENYELASIIRDEIARRQ